MTSWGRRASRKRARKAAQLASQAAQTAQSFADSSCQCLTLRRAMCRVNLSARSGCGRSRLRMCLILRNHDFASERAVNIDEVTSHEQDAKGPPNQPNFKPVVTRFGARDSKRVLRIAGRQDQRI